MDKISSAILKIESALDKKICKNLSEYIEVSPTKKATLLKDNQHIEDTKNRNVFNYGLNINNHHDALYHKLIFNTCNQAIKKYQKLFSSLHQELKLESINLLKYEVGNFYKRHIDAFHMVNRHLSFIINLNEDYKGGELIFYYPHNQQPYSKIELKTGDLIMFPSNFMYPHSIEPIISGTRYSIVCWFS
jgi:predicted 2-oxoglutarate/Fe(II)-dependent dioxygenase YbiX